MHIILQQMNQSIIIMPTPNPAATHPEIKSTARCQKKGKFTTFFYKARNITDLY